ncbi:helix-turn-helix domain-containing protein [Sphingomonas lacusdianchii]|uniref:helix-turn-helix domain-containing protein n=1 Tax=Sphingomonas lacusdianchii TaxID=2917992 RepID=UPI001F58DF4F|nr:helix-turn-helix domain-containing protein [Sphingomonas sp. JXJ CY 53]
MNDVYDVGVELKVEPLAVSVANASRILGIGKTVTYELIKRGKLDTVHIGRRNMVRISSLRQLVGEPSRA